MAINMDDKTLAGRKSLESKVLRVRPGHRAIRDPQVLKVLSALPDLKVMQVLRAPPDLKAKRALLARRGRKAQPDKTGRKDPPESRGR